MESLNVAWNILKVALGLGFVIFIHELGHFLLAKWNGVKVEKFSIGFGPTLASFRRGVGLRIGQGSRPPGPEDPPTYGETEYILAALPLGGYVKMLGESTEGTPEGEEPSSDPRAYNNKPVFGRMGIITAGVIMNVFLGIACYALAASRGGEEKTAAIGGVAPGSPAYSAGLRVGDEIVAIDGKRDVYFTDILKAVALSKEGEPIQFAVKSPGSDGERTLAIVPRSDEDPKARRVGLVSASSLKLTDPTPFRAPPGQESDAKKPANPDGGFKPDDVVVAVGPEGGDLLPVADHDDLTRKLSALRDRIAVIEVDRPGPKKDDGTTGPSSRVKVAVPRHPFLDFGFRLAFGPVSAIRKDSSSGDLKEKDRIVAVDGDKDFDPIALPDYCLAHAGKPVVLTVERAGGEGGKALVTVDLAVTPTDAPTWLDPVASFAGAGAFDIPGLGVSIGIDPKVLAVRDGSPASKAGLKPGDKLKSVAIAMTRPDGKKSKPEKIDLDKSAPGWPFAFAIVQELPWASIEFTTDKSDKPVAIRPEAVAGRFHPDRGLSFYALTKKVPPADFVASLRLGCEEAWESSTEIFTILGRLVSGNLGLGGLGGMIPIAQVAYSQADSGFIPFIHFLGMLSINLAVLNFLPIPPLDGGQFLFLAAEKVRGKPLPDAALNVMQMAGIVFVLGLILFVNVKDVVNLVQSYL